MRLRECGCPDIPPEDRARFLAANGSYAPSPRCDFVLRHVVNRPLASPHPGTHPCSSSPAVEVVVDQACDPVPRCESVGAGTDRLALNEEARAIQVELERSGHCDQFELVMRWAAEPLDLLRELRKLKPTVVHFSGHGGRGAARSDGHACRDAGGEIPGCLDSMAELKILATG